MNFLIPIIGAAVSLKPSFKSLTTPGMIPAPMQFKDPHQPNLDDPRGLPPQLSNKTYWGKIEYPKVAILKEQRPPYGSQFVNDMNALVPFTDQNMRIRLMQQQYRMRDQHVPWQNMQRDFRPLKVLMRYEGKIPSVVSKDGREPSTATSVQFSTGPKTHRIRRSFN